MASMTVSKLADLVGTSADTLRYYERIGLLPKADRTPSGYRLYDDDAVGRVSFIKRAQRLGLRLEEIAQLVDIKEGGGCPCGHTRALLEQRVTQLDEEMAVMARLRDDIQTMLGNLPEVDSTGSSGQCGGELLQIQPQKRPTNARGR